MVVMADALDMMESEESKRVEVSSGVLEDICRGLEDDGGAREDGRHSPIQDNPLRHTGDGCNPPPRREQGAIKPTTRKRTCPHCHIEMHSGNLKKHISRRHKSDTADGCSTSRPIRDNPSRRWGDGCSDSPTLDNPLQRGDDHSPATLDNNRAYRVQRAIKRPAHISICPHCHIEMHAKNLKKHISRKHVDTGDGCSDGPIPDTSPRQEDDDSPILDSPPDRGQQAIKHTARVRLSICPYCNLEIHSKNMKKHISRRHADVAVRDTRAADSQCRDASVPPAAYPRSVDGLCIPEASAQPPDALLHSVVETKEPTELKLEQQPETNGLALHNKGLLGALDEDEYFFLSLVPACKRMAPRKKAQLKLNIMQMVAQAEFEDTDDALVDGNL